MSNREEGKKVIPNHRNRAMDIGDDYYVYQVDVDCDKPFAEICHKDDPAISEKISIPHQLAYYLKTHWCGSQKMHDLIEKNAIQGFRHQIKEILGIEQ